MKSHLYEEISYMIYTFFLIPLKKMESKLNNVLKSRAKTI